MAHAEKCPVCNGEGKLPSDGSSTSSAIKTTCHGCKGKGWVEIADAPSEDNEVHFITNFSVKPSPFDIIGEDVHG